jgi:hypothetical protein
MAVAFHLERPYINNIGNNKRKPSAKQLKAKAEHEAYLRSMGLHPEQLAAKPKDAPRKLKQVVTVDKSGPQVTNGFAPGGAKKSVFDSQWQDRYQDDPLMAEREREALAQAHAKKAQVMPLFNKGGLQYSGNLKMTELGKRRP